MLLHPPDLITFPQKYQYSTGQLGNTVFAARIPAAGHEGTHRSVIDPCSRCRP